MKIILLLLEMLLFIFLFPFLFILSSKEGLLNWGLNLQSRAEEIEEKYNIKDD